jgi:hypothetical protein
MQNIAGFSQALIQLVYRFGRGLSQLGEGITLVSAVLFTRG